MKEKIFEGITNGLGDKHSNYLEKSEVEKFNQSLNTSYEGIGIKFNSQDGKEGALILEVLENGPASKTDIYPGDYIKKVNETIIDETNIKDTADLIKKDKVAKLNLYRPSTNQTFDIEIEKNAYFQESVLKELIINKEEKIGFIKILSFSNTTGEEFAKILADFETQNINKLIIDVRDNGGGEVKAVSEIANLIIPKEKPFLITKRGDIVVDEKFTKLEVKKPYEIIGIQNKNSASASEILMAALKEANGSKIIGETSYGKGSVQRLFPVASTGGMAKITIEHWYTPLGNSIDGVGVEPTDKIAKNMNDPFMTVQQIVLNKNLEKNDQGDFVKLINNYLVFIGLDAELNSNIFSEKTTNSIKVFQERKGLNITGVVDVKTAMELYLESKLKVLNPNFDNYIKLAIGD